MRGKKLEKIVPFVAILDVRGRFIPYCTHKYHKGIVKPWKTCEERKCKHYLKLYLPRGMSLKD